jgi:DNA invertase Pin-like site-specific DNA recombinase
LLTAQIPAGDNRRSMSRRAVAYIRSTEAEAPPAAPPSTQRRAIEAWADRERVEIASWQVDVGVGGDTPIAERPGLVAAYRALRVLGARTLVAANARCFAHDELVSWLIERAALAEGATLSTVDGLLLPRRDPAEASDPDANVGYARGAIDLARAYRRATRAANVRAALADKRARGERIGTVPYGFRLAADAVHTEPDDREQAVIATVRRLSAEGLSQRAIVARLGASGVVGRTGSPLGQTQVAKILRAAG